MRLCECFGENGDQVLCPLGHSLLHKGGKAADEVDAKRICRALQGVCDLEIPFGRCCTAYKRDGSNRNALVNDRDAVHFFNVVARYHKLFGTRGDLIIDLITKTVHVLADAVPQGNAHGDGAYVEVFLADHIDGF